LIKRQACQARPQAGNQCTDDCTYILIDEFPVSQVTLYLDDETDKALSDAASRSGMSRSPWESQLIRRHAQDKWPQECLALAGAFPDFPLSEPRAQASQPAYSPRIPF
jgi:hypothetical protein